MANVKNSMYQHNHSELKIFYSSEYTHDKNDKIPTGSFAQIVGYDSKNHAMIVTLPYESGGPVCNIVYVPSVVNKGKYGVGLRSGLQSRKLSAIGNYRVGQTLGLNTGYFSPYWSANGFPIIAVDKTNKVITFDMDHPSPLQYFNITGEANSNGYYVAMPQQYLSTIDTSQYHYRVKFACLTGTYPPFSYIVKPVSAYFSSADANYDYYVSLDYPLYIPIE
jgi:hypothetical protein